METPDRVTQAREYAIATRGNWRVLCAEAGVKYDWLSKFAQGCIAEPGARKIDALLAHRDQQEIAA